MTERPTSCPDSHPLTWECEHLATCSMGSAYAAVEREKNGAIDLVYTNRQLYESHPWSCRVGSLLGTTDPAVAAARLTALIEVARGYDRHWYHPDGLRDLPGTGYGLRQRMHAALAALVQEEGEDDGNS